jgi:hypothetical protein
MKQIELPLRTENGFYVLQILTVILFIIIPAVMVDKRVSDRQVKLMNLIIQTSYLLLLMSISAVFAARLIRYMTYHNMAEIKGRIISLEVVIQMIIVSRLLTTLLELNSELRVPIVYIMAFSFTTAELIPLTIVVYGIYLQVDWKSPSSLANPLVNTIDEVDSDDSPSRNNSDNFATHDDSRRLTDVSATPSDLFNI